MSKGSDSRWFDLALAGAVTVFVPIVAFCIWPLISPWFASTPRGPVLVYEIAVDAETAGEPVDAKSIANVVDRRLNPNGKKLAVVRPLNDRQIEVAMIRNDDADVQRAEQLLAMAATLEFRILAVDWHDKATIAKALAAPDKARVVDQNGRLLAHWVPVREGEEKCIANYSDIARRVKKQGKREINEVLVVNDDCNLTGIYLKRAEAATDRLGRLLLELRFNTDGGQLFSKLTGSHLPEKSSDRNYKLAMIVNGELHSAPLIVNTIRERAQITSVFSKRELDTLVESLNAGALPAKLRLAAKNGPN